MLSSHRPPSPEVAALRAATMDSCKELRDQAREQARLIRSGAAGELTETDVERMAREMTAAARARLVAAAPHYESPSADPELPSADPELQTTRREAAQFMAAAARQADAELRKAWRARQEKAAGRRWRR